MKQNKHAQIQKTNDAQYTERLLKKQLIWWKRILDVQAPYRWNLRRLSPGFILDIGCGIGRNLVHLNGQGVGIDHNEQSVKIAKNLGLNVFTSEEFKNTEYAHHQFDSLLLAHVAEHMTQQDSIQLLGGYIHLLRPGGKLIMITPQEAGYKSDSTHVEFMDFPKLKNISSQLGLVTSQEYSFPFHRIVGHIFIYNEFVSISYKAEV